MRPLAALIGVQRQDVEHVDAQLFQGARLLVRLHQVEGRLIGPEKHARMRVKGDHAQRGIQLTRRIGGQRDHLLVAQMHAVEVSHGDGAGR